MTLGQGEFVTVSHEQWPTFQSICHELGNGELLQRFKEPITIHNAIEQLLFGNKIDMWQQLAFVAKHFVEMAANIEELSVGLIAAILSQQLLVVWDEDFLYDFVYRIGDLGLFEFVHFQFVSLAKVEHFIDFVLAHFDDANTFLLRCLRSRFQKSVRLQPISTSPITYWNVPDGFISCLTHQIGRNVHDLDVVNITSSGAQNWTLAKSVVNWSDSSYFCSLNTPNSFICFDFKGMRIRPTRYAIKSGPHGPGAQHMKSWVVEGFVDTKWITLDRRINDDSLNFANAARTFGMMYSCLVSRIRIQQIDVNHHGDHVLIMAGFEIYTKASK
jgi:hypothetical protein